MLFSSIISQSTRVKRLFFNISDILVQIWAQEDLRFIGTPSAYGSVTLYWNACGKGITLDRNTSTCTSWIHLSIYTVLSFLWPIELRGLAQNSSGYLLSNTWCSCFQSHFAHFREVFGSSHWDRIWDQRGDERIWTWWIWRRWGNEHRWTGAQSAFNSEQFERRPTTDPRFASYLHQQM